MDVDNAMHDPAHAQCTTQPTLMPDGSVHCDGCGTTYEQFPAREMEAGEPVTAPFPEETLTVNGFPPHEVPTGPAYYVQMATDLTKDQEMLAVALLERDYALLALKEISKGKRWRGHCQAHLGPYPSPRGGHSNGPGVMENCNKRVYVAGHGWGGSQCQSKAAEGCDGFCKQHYPPNVEARSLEYRDKCRAEVAERQRVREAAEAARAEELRRIDEHPKLVARVAELEEQVRTLAIQIELRKKRRD